MVNISELEDDERPLKPDRKGKFWDLFRKRVEDAKAGLLNGSGGHRLTHEEAKRLLRRIKGPRNRK